MIQPSMSEENRKLALRVMGASDLGEAEAEDIFTTDEVNRLLNAAREEGASRPAPGVEEIAEIQEWIASARRVGAAARDADCFTAWVSTNTLDRIERLLSSPGERRS